MRDLNNRAGLLEVEGLKVSIGNALILDGIGFTLRENELLAINGPNGAGKSTLIRAIMKTVPSSGSIRLLNRDIREYKNPERAKAIAVVNQLQNRDFGYTVEEVVKFGLYNRKKGFFDLDFVRKDSELVEEAMEHTGVRPYAKRKITNLSGGELQRVYLAQALTQNPNVLILDEPTNNLDIGFQLVLLDIIKNWASREKKAVIAIIHDLNICNNYADRILMLNKGRQVVFDTPEAVFTYSTLENVYNRQTAEFYKTQ